MALLFHYILLWLVPDVFGYLLIVVFLSNFQQSFIFWKQIIDLAFLHLIFVSIVFNDFKLSVSCLLSVISLETLICGFFLDFSVLRTLNRMNNQLWLSCMLSVYILFHERSSPGVLFDFVNVDHWTQSTFEWNSWDHFRSLLEIFLALLFVLANAVFSWVLIHCLIHSTFGFVSFLSLIKLK